jgi:hypothetical protein
MFTVTTDNFEYKPAAPGLGMSPTYLVTPRNPEGMCIELHYERGAHLPKQDQVCQRILVGAWKVTEYDQYDDAMDVYWFVNFADADAHAFGLWVDSYDHDELMAGG